jgi:hypothetical protein
MSLSRIFTTGITVVIAVVLTWSGLALGAGSGTFGNAPTYNSDTGFTLSLSDDKKAFTALFSNLLVQLIPNSPQPIITRTFSFSLPLSGIDSGTEIPFFISGAASCGKGTSAHLVFTVNDQTMVADFPENTTNTDFVQQLKYKAGSASEIRVTINLMADRDSKSGGEAFLNVLAIDTDLLNREDKQNLLKKAKEFFKKRSGAG